MKLTADYKSRFRILKGGKISLVVSALLVGTIVNASSMTVGNNTSLQNFTSDANGSSLTVSGALNITSAATGLIKDINVTTAGFATDIEITGTGSISSDVNSNGTNTQTYGVFTDAFNDSTITNSEL